MAERELKMHAWYRYGDPLVRLLADTLFDARMDDADEEGTLWCSDSNGAVNVLKLAKKIEALTPKHLPIYTNTSKQVGDPDHLKVFADEAAADEWFRENDKEGVAFAYEVIQATT